jgi:hypothetical protein
LFALPKLVNGQLLAETRPENRRKMSLLNLAHLLEPASKRAAVAVAIQQHGISERRVCRLRQLARSTQRRKLRGKS